MVIQSFSQTDKKKAACHSALARIAWRIVLFFWLAVSLLASSMAEGASRVEAGAEPVMEARAKKKLQLLSTLKPVHWLVREIAGELAVSSLLIPDTMNTHDYSFRPSDLRKLARADVVIRISSQLETFLDAALIAEKRVISLEAAPGIYWLPVRDKDHHEAHGAHHGSHLQAVSYRDYHIWLDPRQALLLARYISQKLGQIDPAHATTYEANRQRLSQRINHAYQQTRQYLQMFKATPYLVFHDAWHYWEQAYDLSQPHVISWQEGLPPGLKTLHRLRQQIREENVRCLIASPRNNQRLIGSLTEDLHLRTHWLSPVGAQSPARTYPEWILSAGQQFASCLDSFNNKLNTSNTGDSYLASGR